MLDVREIGRQLQAGAVLEGSVRRQGNQLRISAQLANTHDGFRYWSREWDREDKDVFAVQEEIARQVAASLQRNLETRAPLVRDHSSNLEAYNLYLQGRFYIRRDEAEALNRAIRYFQQATEKDRDFTAAYVGLATAYWVRENAGESSAADAYIPAKKAVDKALALEPSSSGAHSILGILQAAYEWNWSSAEKEFRLAAQLDPSNNFAPHNYSHLLAALGRFDESLQQSRISIDLDPVDLTKRGHLCWHYLMARDNSRAIAACKEVLDMDDSDTGARVYLRWVYEESGQFDKAVDIMEHERGQEQSVAAFRDGFKRDGAKGYWQALRDHELAKSRGGFLRVNRIVKAYARLGEKAEALAWLEKGFQQRDSTMMYLKTDPSFDGLRDEPRFVELVRRVGLP
jgi:Tfp pilus assembly protein PilF